MGTPRALTAGDRVGGAHIEYVKSRRVLRLQGHGDTDRAQTVEVPLHAFLERLDIDLADLDVPRRYLLFSGRAGPRGGFHDLSGVFDSEQTGRAAFHEMLTDQRSPSSWAQLVVLDHRGRAKPLCWFEGQTPPATLADGERSAPPRRPRTRRPAILGRRRR